MLFIEGLSVSAAMPDAVIVASATLSPIFGSFNSNFDMLMLFFSQQI